jgi:outer membrane murein-binding lipoprotein Lpp
MKTRLTIITSILLSLIIFSGCQSESTPENLQEDVKEIKRIANNSENIEDKEDAFEILRNLNQKMKDVRDNILAMEAKYRTASENKKREMESEFKEANAQIDESLGVIRENVDPYKNEQEVSKMIDKLNEILISK